MYTGVQLVYTAKTLRMLDVCQVDSFTSNLNQYVVFSRYLFFPFDQFNAHEYFIINQLINSVYRIPLLDLGLP